MFAERARMDAYARALRQAIHADSIVVDIGAGTGIFSLLACRFGARRVYAIEMDDAIEVAREIAAANGFADRIQFIQDRSTRVALPEQADVVISDMRGILPWYGHNIDSVIDARQRFLAPGGALISLRDTLWAAIVEVPKLCATIWEPWVQNGYGLNMEAAMRVVTNAWLRAELKPEQLLTEPQCIAALDYTTVKDRNLSAKATWSIMRDGVAHGMGVWFDATVAEGIGFTNAPGAPEGVYGRAFFPWSTPTSLKAGDSVSVALRADFVSEDYVWTWRTCVRDGSNRGGLKVSYDQSSFFGSAVSLAHLRKREAGFVPALEEDGEIDRLILESMDGCTPQHEIAKRAFERFPAHFRSWEDALTRVGDLSQKYSR
jgi:protein arginine N-methyltransferase 1